MNKRVASLKAYANGLKEKATEYANNISYAGTLARA